MPIGERAAREHRDRARIAEDRLAIRMRGEERLMEDAERHRRRMVSLGADLFEHASPFAFELGLAERRLLQALGEQREATLGFGGQELARDADGVTAGESAQRAGHAVDLARDLVASPRARAAGEQPGDEVVDAGSARILVALAAQEHRAHRDQARSLIGDDEQAAARRQLHLGDAMLFARPCRGRGRDRVARQRSRRDARERALFGASARRSADTTSDDA